MEMIGALFYQPFTPLHSTLYSAYNLILLLSAVIEERKVQLEIIFNNNNKMTEVTPG